ncbi:UDP-N-acetylmuramoyl-L-alanine--D-glutamate ligase, partial [Patescibacteria group bacterium]
MDQHSKIAILGFGVEGKAILEYLQQHDYENIMVCDQNLDLKEELPDGVSAQLGEHYLSDLDKFDVVYRSPGIRYLEPEIQAAKVAGAVITSSTVDFMDQCPCPIIGVTGTKGKGTTSTLIYKILKRAGKDVYLGGNIGEPAIEFLDDLNHDSIVALELSSFQLHDLTKSPRYAIFLNTTVDHLDYHVDQDEYMTAKESILAHQHEDNVAIMNKDYDYFEHYKPLVKGTLYTVSLKEKIENGAYVKDERIYYAVDGESVELMDVSDVKLTGAHNLENVLPSVVICKELGVDDQDIVAVVKEFEGLPHRLQFVREVGDVRYFNDSNATGPYPSMAAVDSFDEPTVLIAGGSSKEEDYDEWALKILMKPNLHTVVLMGATADKMEEALREAEGKLGEAEGSPTAILRRHTLHEVVVEASKQA